MRAWYTRLGSSVVRFQSIVRGRLDRNRIQDQLNDAMIQDESNRLARLIKREAAEPNASPPDGEKVNEGGESELVSILDVDMVMDLGDVYTSGWKASIHKLQVSHVGHRVKQL